MLNAIVDAVVDLVGATFIAFSVIALWTVILLISLVILFIELWEANKNEHECSDSECSK